MADRLSHPALCPVCFRPVPEETPARVRPFCSLRCAEVDLGRWFTGGYRVAGALSDLDGEEDAEPGPETPRRR